MQTHQKMVVSNKLVKVGPWGGTGGSPWDDGGHSGIRSITLAYGRCIDSMSVEFDKDSSPVPGEKHGGTGGHHTTQIKLNYPDEFLTGVSGWYSPVVRSGSPVIRSLAFKTNRRTFGPFGVAEGTPFTFPVDEGAIVGFSGRSGWYIDAIGLYIAPVRPKTFFDKVTELGFMALRSLVHMNGPEQREKQEHHQDGSVQSSRLIQDS